ncbi:tRNA 2-selenouridine(34) synthase MnmH [Suttonella sp. R2A3]|uniref:tRNA 2-selenouridine(34) synthase MnmH n=1 Tax=Suttonella sp. R2A3 TaxID=2908648 RepID=UPI0038FCBC7E
MDADKADYQRLILNDIPLIDTRAPAEFSKGALPMSTNLPLMDDNERAQVGTCYKKYGQHAAIALGHQLVSGTRKTTRIEAWLNFAHTHPQGYLYCWRGGLRSQIVQSWLAEAGISYPRICGGYKALRQFLLEQQTAILRDTPMIILAGYTGSGKTDLLKKQTKWLDLEGLANHRGSAFGKHPDGQPTQLNFENRLACALIKAQYHYPNQPLLLEDESHLIGRCAVPPDLRATMQRAPIVLVEADLASRVAHSFTHYILDKLNLWQTHLGEEAGFDAFSDDLRQSLANLRKRLGGLRYQQLAKTLESALIAHRRGNPEQHHTWIEALLREYYDPMYAHQLEQKSARVLYRGNTEAVHAYLQETNL